MSEARQSSGREWTAVAALAVALGGIVAVFIATQAWERVKMRPPDRSIEVTGSAKKRIVSDLIEWNATVEANAPDRVAAYKRLAADVSTVVAYLQSQKIPADAIRPSSARVEAVYETVWEGKGEDRIEKQVLTGWQATQSIVVSSTDVALVERVSREITQLLEGGVVVTSSQPRYFYTKLGELKIAMLAEAAKDARTRAENMLGSAGGARLGKLRTADMGVINVNPANSSATSWEGNNDTSALDKDIIAIVHVTFELE